MIRTHTLFAVAAAALLAGCNRDNTIVAEGPDTRTPTPKPLQANGPVALPPSVAASKTYRCADNSIVHIDWLSDGKSANVRTDEGGTVQVAAPEAGQPMTGGTGYLGVRHRRRRLGHRSPPAACAKLQGISAYP